MKYSISILSVIFLLLNGSNFKEVETSTPTIHYKINPLILTDFKNIRDTIYTMEDHIVEVNLSTHMGKVRYRNGELKEFPISGGTKNVVDGMETNEGLFVIQWKSRKQYSAQFDSTVLLYWMGFNNGIGFHALTSNGYYKYLGKKNVSHGCVRVSREDGEELYKILEKGTPVLVIKGNSAIEVAFGKLGEVYKYYSYPELKKKLSQNLHLLYNGKYLISKNYKLLIDEENVLATGLQIGSFDRIPTKQVISSNQIYLSNDLNEENKLETIFSEDTELYTNLSLHPYLDSLYAQTF